MYQIAGLQQIISGALDFVITPAILLVILVWAVVIVARAAKGPVRTSAAAGLGAGIVLFVIYVSVEMDSLDVLAVAGLNVGSVLTVQIMGLAVGAVYGILLILLVRFLIGTRLTGVLVLFLTMSSLAAMYSYFFGGSASYRTLVQFLSLGTAFGIFLHILIFPASVRSTPSTP